MIALTPPVLLISVNANVQQEEWERDVTKFVVMVTLDRTVASHVVVMGTHRVTL